MQDSVLIGFPLIKLAKKLKEFGSIALLTLLTFPLIKLAKKLKDIRFGR